MRQAVRPLISGSPPSGRDLIAALCVAKCHNRTHAPQQTAFIQAPSTPRISLAASPEKREYSRHFRSHPGNPG
jgi:hypothetical protein